MIKRALIACEESQAVTLQLRQRGVEAFSCDILPPSGGAPEWHIQGDLAGVLNDKQWDLIIAFPPCIYLTVTGNAWFNVDKYGTRATTRYWLREQAIAFFMAIATAPAARIAIENPVGVMSRYWRKPDQIIQPWQFGDPYEKKTCLWLKGLPPLVATDIVTPEPRYYSAKHGKPRGRSYPGWFQKASGLSAAERSRVRSKTFPGIAAAMADQWGGL